MKKRYLLYVGMLVLPLTLSGCSSSVAKLAVESDEVVTIDATAKVNPSDYLKDVAEDAEVNYSISDGVMTITVSKDDKTETFEVPVTIEEPRVSIDEDITIDTYVGYDIEEYIHEDEGVSHTTNFNEETGELSVTFTKGEWSTTLDGQVEVTSSEPEEIWPKVYSGTDCFGIADGTRYLYEDGTCTSTYSSVSYTASGTYTFDGEKYRFDGCTDAINGAISTGWVRDYGFYENWVGESQYLRADGSELYTTWVLIEG